MTCSSEVCCPSQLYSDCVLQHLCAALHCCLQLEEDMARRAANDNYESDIEEEEAAAAQQHQHQQDEAAGAGGEEATAALRVLAEAEKKVKELQDQEERLKVGAVCQQQRHCAVQQFRVLYLQ